MARVSPLSSAWILILVSQNGCPAAENPPQDPAYIAELSDRKLLVDAFDSDTWEALVKARTSLEDLGRAREALQIWRRNMAKKGLPAGKVDLAEAALEDAAGNTYAALGARLRFLEVDPKNLQVWRELFFRANPLTEAVAADASERAAKALSAKEYSSVWIPVVEAAVSRYDTGRARYDTGRAGAALDLWRRGLQKLKSTHPQLDHLQGDVDWTEGRHREAVQAWNSSLRADSKNPLLLEKLFCAHQKMGNPEEAMEVITRLIKVQETAPNYCRRAHLYVLKREWKDARADVFKAYKTEPTAEASKSLYPVFEGFDSWFSKVKNLDDQVRKARTPESKSAALLERAKLFVGLGLYAAAREDAAEALKAAPGSLVAKLWLGACTNQTGNSQFMSVVGDAESLLKREDSLRDLDSLALPQQIQRLLELGQNEIARELLSLQQAGAPSKETAASLLESDLKLYETAKLTSDVRFGRRLQRLLEMEPGRGDLWLKLGEYQLNNGNLDQALDCARKAEANGAGAAAKPLIQSALQRRITP